MTVTPLNEELTMLSEPQDEDSDIIVERPQPRTSARKKFYQIVDDFIGVGHYMDGYQKLKKEFEATIIPHKDVYMYKDMENITHLKIHSCCSISCAIHAPSFSQPELLSI
jgi:hypothetical protein